MNIHSISFALFAPCVVCEGERVFVGLLNRRKFAEGMSVYGPIGGLAQLTIPGVQRVWRYYGVSLKRERDAIFNAPLSMTEETRNRMIDELNDRENGLREIDPMREIVEELATKDFPGVPPILDHHEATLIQARFVKSVVQRNPDNDAPRESFNSKDPPVSHHRYFDLFEMTMPDEVFKKLTKHELIRTFTEEEVATTRGGLRWGRSRNGDLIGSNFIW